MFIGLNMGLYIWDSGEDFYVREHLEANFQALDDHDHTPGRGKRIPGAALEDASVSETKLASNSVTGNKILDGTVGPNELAPDAVGRVHLQDDAVGTDELEDGIVTFGKLDPDVRPIGEVIMWYRPTNVVPIPTGWEVCDGRPWNSVPNAWGHTTGNMPNFSNRVPLGAALSGTGTDPASPPDIGATGGAMTVSLAHSHTVNSHTHSVPSHAHSIAYEPNHEHGMFDANRGNDNVEGNVPGNDDYPEPFAFLAHIHHIAGAGEHDHGGQTGGSGTLTTGAATPSTNSQLDTEDIRNRYVGVLFLMRVL